LSDGIVPLDAPSFQTLLNMSASSVHSSNEFKFKKRSKLDDNDVWQTKYFNLVSDKISKNGSIITCDNTHETIHISKQSLRQVSEKSPCAKRPQLRTSTPAKCQLLDDSVRKKILRTRTMSIQIYMVPNK
jgi:hypothetical protein